MSRKARPRRRPPSTLADRRERLATRLLETRGDRPPYPEEPRWRRHRGQGVRLFRMDDLALDGTAALLAVALARRRP